MFNVALIRDSGIYWCRVLGGRRRTRSRDLGVA